MRGVLPMVAVNTYCSAFDNWWAAARLGRRNRAGSLQRKSKHISCLQTSEQNGSARISQEQRAPGERSHALFSSRENFE